MLLAQVLACRTVLVLPSIWVSKATVAMSKIKSTNVPTILFISPPIITLFVNPHKNQTLLFRSAVFVYYV